MKCFFVFVLLACASCKTTTYYVVRHAEKEAGTTMTATTTKSSDVPLSAADRERAEALKESLENKNVKYIFSTNTLRTRSTAKPLSDALGVTLRLYDAVDSNFIQKLRKIADGNVVIVAHSNTVDDIVNGIAGETKLSDLPDGQYGDLFVLYKNAKHYQLDRKHFGK